MTFRPEDPERIRTFRRGLQDLQWNDAQVVASLETLFAAVDNLAEEEVRYYYRRRGTRAWISGLARTGAWLLGTIGLLLPLFAATLPDTARHWGQWGYVFLAGAASCLAANSLFGGTDGHVRFVSTQLTLEKLITSSRIDWCRYLASKPATAEEIAAGFALVHAYADGLHTTTLAETGKWGEGALAELARFQQGVEARNVAGGPRG